MTKIKWCVIGAGGIADRRGIPALLENKNSEITAVMDKNAEVSKRIAEKYNIAKWYKNEEEMLKCEKPDAVYIATPVKFHFEQAMLCLKYGANAFIEKPIAMNKEESEKLLNAFKKENRQITIGYMMGYHSLHRTARRLIAAGEVGEITSVRMLFSCWYPEIQGAWRQNKALGGGGCIMDLAVHCMELFYNLTGDEIKELKTFYSTATFNYEVEDGAVIAFRSEGGIQGVIQVNFNIPDDCALSSLEIYGTKGSITATGTLGQEDKGKLKFTRSSQVCYEAAQNRSVSKSKNYYPKGKNLYSEQFADFVKLLLSGKTDYKNASQAVNIQRLCDKIYSAEH